MEAGLPGQLGLLAAPPVELAFKFANVPAVTQAHGMVVVYAWDRTVKKGIVMNTFCAPHTCSGQAGVHGNIAQLNVEEGFRPATEPARMALNVLAAMLSIRLATPTPVQS